MAKPMRSDSGYGLSSSILQPTCEASMVLLCIGDGGEHVFGFGATRGFLDDGQRGRADRSDALSSLGLLQPENHSRRIDIGFQKTLDFSQAGTCKRSGTHGQDWLPVSAIVIGAL